MSLHHHAVVGWRVGVGVNTASGFTLGNPLLL
jgi:hypothetical protein